MSDSKIIGESPLPFNTQKVKTFTVVEFTVTSLMDPLELDRLGVALYKLVDEQDVRMLLLDFERVQYLSSQAIGIVMGLRRRLAALDKSMLVLCGVGPKLLELLRITGLDRVLPIKHSQREAILAYAP